MIYLELLILSMIVIYIVDISGFTDTWRSGLAHLLKVKALKPLPPFDCSKCMTWWTCLLYCAIVGRFSLFTVAFSALLSLFSFPLCQLFILIREWTLRLIDKMMPR